jgi:processive 1,2-diacylglycerol beta-glucosyltransferase
MPVLDQVLILSASAGAGHMRAGQAIERAFLEAGAARSVRHLDTLEYTNALFRRLYSRA